MENYHFIKNPVILDSLSEGIIFVRYDGKVLYVNDAYSTILNIPKEKILNKNLRDIHPNAKILKVLETKKELKNLNHVVESTDRRIISNIKPIFENSNFLGAVNIFRDITDVINLSKQLSDLKDYNDQLEKEIINREMHMKDTHLQLIGQHPKIISTLKVINKVADLDTTVLLIGESGTGKEIFASMLHYLSSRRNKPFIKVNCAAIPDSLLESELFGYEEGAFTGSRKGGRTGKFQQANGGTFFLDEIGEMSLNMQAKLLRSIQEKSIEKVGGEKTIDLDIRIIAATNRDLKKLVSEGQFREDLFYRINVFPIYLPPLRERGDDIILLSGHFIDEYSALYKKSLSLSDEVEVRLLNHDFKGNVRELKNIIEYAVIMAPQDGEITLEHVPSLQKIIDTGDYKSSNKKDLQAIGNYDLSLKEKVGEIEKKVIQDALLNTKNKSEAIKMLGLSRKSFYEKLKKYNLN